MAGEANGQAGPSHDVCDITGNRLACDQPSLEPVECRLIEGITKSRIQLCLTRYRQPLINEAWDVLDSLDLGVLTPMPAINAPVPGVATRDVECPSLI